MVPAMAALRGSFSGVASFVTVYVAEAHARELFVGTNLCGGPTCCNVRYINT
jgi:hypothetical protein